MWHGASVRSIKTARSDDDDDGSAARCTLLVLENLGSGAPPPTHLNPMSIKGGHIPPTGLVSAPFWDISSCQISDLRFLD